MATSTPEEDTRSPQKRKLDGADDRISRLPDCILHEILSLLILKESAATTILTKRWRHLFTSLPELQFDEFSFISHSELPLEWDEDGSAYYWADNILNILESRSEPLKSCTISCCYLSQYRNDFNAIFRRIFDNGIESLSFENIGDCYTVSPSLFFCQELTDLYLSLCKLTVPSKFNALRCLRDLQLVGCVINEPDLERLLSSCTALERLNVEKCNEVRSMIVNAHKLKVLKISTTKPLTLSVANAPHLESVDLQFAYDIVDKLKLVWLLHKKKLNRIDEWNGEIDAYDFSGEGELCQLVRLFKDLGSIQNLSLNLNSTYLELLRDQKVPVPKVLPVGFRLCKLKKLTMKMYVDMACVLPIMSCLLNSCPVLEELVVDHNDEYGCRKFEGVDCWEKLTSSDCISNRLATVTLYPVMIGSDYWIIFTKFLLGSVSCLKKMIVDLRSEVYEPATFELFQKEVVMLQTVFPETVLELKPSRRRMRRYQ